jgi:prepilin-type N-terminal cleavage/methylation domain-containing protein
MGLMRKAKSNGFTLVELLIVIAIISILVAIVVIAVDPVRIIQESRDSKNRSELNGVKSALQLYFNEHNAYPADLSALVSDYIRVLPTPTGGISYDGSAVTDYTASISVSHVIPADEESELRCTGADTQDVGDPGTFYICAD